MLVLPAPYQNFLSHPGAGAVAHLGLDMQSDFGADGLGSGEDCAPMLEAALRGVPTTDTIGIISRPHGAVEIRFGSVSRNDEPAIYYFSRPVVWPDEIKSVNFTTTSGGAVLWLADNQGGYLMEIPTGDRHVTFDGMLFYKCGIQWEAGARLFFRFEDVVFVQSPDHALRALGDSVHNIHGDGLYFLECAGAIWQETSCETWEFENVHVWRCGKAGSAIPPVIIQSTHTTLSDFDLEAQLNNTASSYIALFNGPNTIENIRAGSEAPTGYSPPAYVFEVGLPTGTSGAPTNPSWVRGLCFDKIISEGNSTPSATSSKGVLRCNVPLRQSVFTPQLLTKHYAELVSEAYLDAAPGDGQYAFDNVWNNRGQQVVNLHVGGDFSHGGIGWNIPDDVTSPDTTVSLGFASAGNVVFAKNPGGLSVVQQTTPNDWWLVTCTSTSDYLQWSNSTDNLDTNKITFQVQAKAGTLARFRMWIKNLTTGYAITSPYKIFHANTSRQTYRVTGPFTAGNKYLVQILPGIGGASDTGTIYFSTPQLLYSTATITP